MKPKRNEHQKSDYVSYKTLKQMWKETLEQNSPQHTPILAKTCDGLKNVFNVTKSSL